MFSDSVHCSIILSLSPPPPPQTSSLLFYLSFVPSRELLWLKSFLVRLSFVFTSAVIILSIRLYLNGGDPPLFVESDNPASFSPHFLTRFLTYSHLLVLNLWLLLCPSRLCFDWSMDSIPLVQSVSDKRNIWSVLVVVLLFIFLVFVGKSTCDYKVHFSWLVRGRQTPCCRIFIHHTWK